MYYAVSSKLMAMLGCFAIVWSALVADDNGMNRAEKIYNDAMLQKMRQTYSALIIDSKKDKRLWTRLYQKKNVDGTVWTRMETPTLSGYNIVILNNNEGKYYLAGDFGVKNDYEMAIEKKMMATSNTISLPKPEFRMSETVYNQTPCYSISLRMQLTREYIDMYTKAYNRLPEKIVDSIPICTEYLIGKEDKFIYSTKSYNDNQKLLSQLDYADVKINPDLDDSLFQVPEKMKITIARSEEEFSKQTTEALVKATPKKSSIEKKTFWQPDYIDLIFKYGAPVLFWVGIACVAIMILIKVKTKRS